MFLPGCSVPYSVTDRRDGANRFFCTGDSQNFDLTELSISVVPDTSVLSASDYAIVLSLTVLCFVVAFGFRQLRIMMLNR